jgi:sulfane dehydrogenase subunit SoxC
LRRNFEPTVLRRTLPWLTADSASSDGFTRLPALAGIITQHRLCLGRHRAGNAAIDPARQRLVIHGLADAQPPALKE